MKTVSSLLAFLAFLFSSLLSRLSRPLSLTSVRHLCPRVRTASNCVARRRQVSAEKSVGEKITLTLTSCFSCHSQLNQASASLLQVAQREERERELFTVRQLLEKRSVMGAAQQKKYWILCTQFSVLNSLHPPPPPPPLTCLCVYVENLLPTSGHAYLHELYSFHTRMDLPHECTNHQLL